MAISHSSIHLLVPVVFVFCLLSSLVQAENDYTDSRQLEKKLAVSRQRNNIRWLPNYNWKPPEHYGLRYPGKPQEKSTEKKAEMEFTKPEDPEQRIEDPWIKKVQEISRQKREKWVPYKRNENEKLALDNVEETTRTNKLTDDESITQFDPTILMTIAQPLVNQDNTNVKDLHDSSLLQFTDTNADRLNKKLDPWSAENPSAEIQEAPVGLHRQYKDYEISDIKEDIFDKQNETVADYERSELEKDRSFISKVNSHSKESISQESKTKHSLNDTRRNAKKYSSSDANLDYKSNSEESPAKEYPRQSNLSENDKEDESNKNSKRHDEKIVTTKSLTRKSKKKRDDTEEDTTGRSLNHGGSFHPARWGMSILSPPMEFLKNIFPGSMYWKNKHTEKEKDGRYDLTSRQAVNVTSRLKEFLEDILMHRAGHSTVEPESRSNRIKGSFNPRSLIHQNHQQNSQTDSTQRLIIDEHDKKPATLNKFQTIFIILYL